VAIASQTARHPAAALGDPDSFVAGAPYELFSQLRDAHPVAWTPEESPNTGFWSVTRHADITNIGRDWETFSSSRGVSLEDLDDDQLIARTSLIDTDPPRHTELRKVMASQFLPRIINGFETFLRGVVATTLDRTLPPSSATGTSAHRTFDFVEQVSSQIPVRVLSQMLSVPDTDHARLTSWGDRLVGNTDPELTDVMHGSIESEAYRLLPFRSPAAQEIFDYGRELQAARRTEPTGDLITRLVEAEVGGEALSQQDLDNYFLLLLLAGQETTRQAITLAIQTLIDHPEVLARLQDQPSLLSGTAADELLRWGPPVLHMRRTATRDVEVAGTAIKAGDKIAMWYPSGNRDERVFDHADVLDIGREKVDLLTFGKGGPHYCMGSFLAKLEFRVTLEELVSRIDTIAAAGPPERVRSNFVNGVKRMPVIVTTR
jgi:cytochrome P450